jgi:transposase
MKIICGVDVSKARLDACIEPGSIFASFDNDPAGIAALAAFCRQHQAGLAVMEATGGYERRAFLLLWEAGMPCAMTNPRSVRRCMRRFPASPIAGMKRWVSTSAIPTGTTPS